MIMATAIFRSGMTGMLVAVIGDLKFNRLQGGQLVLHALNDRIHDGRVFLKGLTVTWSYTPALRYGSAIAQDSASCSEANSATMRLPV